MRLAIKNYMKVAGLDGWGECFLMQGLKSLCSNCAMNKKSDFFTIGTRL
jgi:hypothetical protein